MEHKRNSPRSCQFLLPLLHDYINHYFSSLFSLFFVLHFSLAMKIDLTIYLHTVAVEELVCVKTNIFKSNLIFKDQYQVLTIIIKTKKFRKLFMRKRFHNYQLCSFLIQVFVLNHSSNWKYISKTQRLILEIS